LEAFFAPAGGTNESPEAFALMENYPNPFNPSTTITFTTAETGPVRLSVFDLLGRRVTTLVEGVLPAGMHQARWEAGEAASGVYLYRLEAGGVVRTRRMILMK
ncbi:T9SS type A sorting domain-containing protein, partial [Rhodocaloribacter sp.]